MGDVDSTTLGATIAITLLNSNENSFQAWSALSVTFPLISNAVYTLASRLLRGENIFQAHRSHLYQRLQQSGFTHAQVTFIYLLLTLCTIGIVCLFARFAIAINLILTVVAIAMGEFYLRFRLSCNQEN